jgi:hypothetical protein
VSSVVIRVQRIIQKQKFKIHNYHNQPIQPITLIYPVKYRQISAADLAGINNTSQVITAKRIYPGQ